MPLKHGTTSISDAKQGTTDLGYVYHDNTRVFVHYFIHTLTYNALTPNITITVNRTNSPRAEAPTGNLSSGAPIYTGDVLQITATADSGYYVYDTSTRDQTTYTETVTVSGDVNKSYSACQKISGGVVSGTTGSIVGSDGYYRTSGITKSVTDAITTGAYIPYVSVLSGAYEISSYSSSSVTCVLKSSSSNTLVSGTLYYYRYAAISVSAPVQLDYVFNPFEVTLQNTNSFDVQLEVKGSWADSDGTHTISSWKNLGTVATNSSTIVYPSDMASNVDDDAVWDACSLHFRFAYTFGGVTTYYSSEYMINE